MRLQAVGCNVLTPGLNKNFPFLQDLETSSGVHPVPFFGQGMKLNHSSPSSTVMKNEWQYTSSPLYACMMCTGTILPIP